jgi:hypothetical protein
LRKHLITFAFFVLAIVCYSLGAVGPGIVFFVLGGLAELVFWFRLLGSGRGD